MAADAWWPELHECAWCFVGMECMQDRTPVAGDTRVGLLLAGGVSWGDSCVTFSVE
jgi:hypothetical protein